MTLTVRAPAKINLHLGVGPARPDGYHALATVYQAIGLYDDVTASDADEWSVSVTVTGDVDASDVPLDDRNIAIRAGHALCAHHGIDRRARLEIAKNIPVAGGLAGGSADAAATLVALDRLWDLRTSDDDLLEHVRRHAQTLFHPVATCAMGTGEDAVVDPSLAVRGVTGLRVVDASVMPEVPRGNTNAPTIMIAEKAADEIRNRS